MLKAANVKINEAGWNQVGVGRPAFYFAWGCFRDFCKAAAIGAAAPPVFKRRTFPQCGMARPTPMVAATPRMLRGRNTRRRFNRQLSQLVRTLLFSHTPR